MEGGFKLLPTGSANLPSAHELKATVWRNLSLSERRRPSTTEPFRTLRDTSCLSFCARPALHRASASLTSLLARGFRPRRPSPRTGSSPREICSLLWRRFKHLFRIFSPRFQDIVAVVLRLLLPRLSRCQKTSLNRTYRLRSKLGKREEYHESFTEMDSASFCSGSGCVVVDDCAYSDRL